MAKATLTRFLLKRYSSSCELPYSYYKNLAICKQSYLYSSTTGIAPTGKIHTYDGLITDADKNGGRERAYLRAWLRRRRREEGRAKRFGVLRGGGRRGIVKLGSRVFSFHSSILYGTHRGPPFILNVGLVTMKMGSLGSFFSSVMAHEGKREMGHIVISTFIVMSLEASVPQQLREPTRPRIFFDSPPDSLLFLAVVDLFGADVLWERRIRWVMYIFSSIRIVLPS